MRRYLIVIPFLALFFAAAQSAFADEEREKDRERDRPPKPAVERLDDAPRPRGDGPPDRGAPPRRPKRSMEWDGERPPTEMGMESGPMPMQPQRPDGDPPRGRHEGMPGGMMPGGMMPGRGPGMGPGGPAPGMPGMGGAGVMEPGSVPFGPGMMGGGPMGGGMEMGMGGMPGHPADPEMFELDQVDRNLEHKSHQLAIRFRQTEGEEREKIAEELADVVNEHFTIRQKRRKLEIERIERELRKLLENVQAREEAREDIIHRRLMELKGEDDRLRF